MAHFEVGANSLGVFVRAASIAADAVFVVATRLVNEQARKNVFVVH